MHLLISNGKIAVINSLTRFTLRITFTRLIALLGMKNMFSLDFGLTAEEEQSHLSEYTEVRKQLDKTKKRLKTLVRANEAQLTLLRGLARKIDPETEVDWQSLDEIKSTVTEEQKALSQELLHDELPPIEIQENMPHAQKTYV